MNFTKEQKDTAMVVLASLLLMVVLAYTYFGFYSPAKEARLQTEQTLSSEREVLMALENQLKQMPQTERISASELQQKVAVEPLTDLILLQVEQAELMSGTLIKSVSFTEGPVDLLAPVEGVENIQEVLTSIELEAYDYESITAFIKEIESMKRIMIVDAINFAAAPEQTEQVTEDEPLSVSLQFSAFYRPDLIALSDTAPKVDAPAPANKVNPMPQNDGTSLVTDASDSEADETTEDTNSNVAGTQTSSYHKVGQGDTLSSISMKYYGTEKGEEWIKEANNLPNAIISVGTVLTIPARP
ncbi:LysM peptidoglycan-binding domain-containing protein [Planomicrobium sp. MB-3u-38]|uniref:LysM peptidoglycan-binding domain-containing protein n=1 Tax=Planomicrobium sp. MB-3u-38 TaxID=2058318 RepID=UPI000C79567E|nr:LysM peptidoglycan-binding domain-containing protein [Planomicrobium sp. MB-3u-38]PKH08462.1 pilus assembly protein PilO [Planomicrobium sp. MB-3u-38]